MNLQTIVLRNILNRKSRTTLTVLGVSVSIAAFVALCGCIRFGIAIWRRHKGIYPPATSQMEGH